MANTTTTSKRSLIDKANTRLVMIVAGASFIVIFSLVASKALLSQRSYQARVISQKKVALNQLKANDSAVQTLVTSYKSFIGTAENRLGGNPSGKGDKDGDNAKLVLDALPSKYDFPALATSLEKILTDRSYKIQSISGSDDEVAQGANDSSATPSPVDIPFQLSVSGSYSSMQSLMDVFQSSIRPFHMNQLEFVAQESTVSLNMTAKTYYQPEKSLNITTKVVK